MTDRNDRRRRPEGGYGGRYPRDMLSERDRYNLDRNQARYANAPYDQEEAGGRYAPGMAGYGETHSPDTYATQMGRYYGRGPKNYQRSDDRIREDVSDRLMDHGQIDATDVEVRVENGEVTLSGTAADRRQKRLAADLAEDVRGVRDVHNEIRLRRASEGEQGPEQQ